MGKAAYDSGHGDDELYRRGIVKFFTKALQYNPNTDMFDYPVSKETIDSVAQNFYLDKSGKISNNSWEFLNKISTPILNKLGISGDVHATDNSNRIGAIFFPWSNSLRAKFLDKSNTLVPDDSYLNNPNLWLNKLNGYFERRYNFATNKALNAINERIKTYQSDPNLYPFQKDELCAHLKGLKYDIEQLSKGDYELSRLSPERYTELQKLLRTRSEYQGRQIELIMKKRFGDDYRALSSHQAEIIKAQQNQPNNNLGTNPFQNQNKTDWVQITIYVIIAIIVAYIIYRIIKWLYRWYKKRKAQKANKIESSYYNYTRLLNLCETDETHQVGVIYNSYMNPIINFFKEVFSSVQVVMKYIYSMLSLGSKKLSQWFTTMFNKNKPIDDLKKEYRDMCNNIQRYSNSVYLRDQVPGIMKVLPKV